MRKKEAAKLLKEVACVFPRMSATLRVGGEARDARPFIDGATMGVAYAAMLLDGERDGIEDADAVEEAERILNAAIEYNVHGGKRE